MALRAVVRRLRTPPLPAISCRRMLSLSATEDEDDEHIRRLRSWFETRERRPDDWTPFDRAAVDKTMPEPEPDATEDDVAECLERLDALGMKECVLTGIDTMNAVTSGYDGKPIIPVRLADRWKRLVVVRFTEKIEGQCRSLPVERMTDQQVSVWLEKTMVRVAMDVLELEDDVISFLCPTVPQPGYIYTEDGVEYKLIERHLFLNGSGQGELQFWFYSRQHRFQPMISSIILKPDQLRWPGPMHEILEYSRPERPQDWKKSRIATDQYMYASARPIMRTGK
ncbi:Uncharacterized protein PBTT_08093 [Plasmodiophora brassicae]